MQKVNKKNFKKALSNFATGVTIVSINYKNDYIGKTVNSFSSVSLNPPLVLFSLDKKSSSLNKFLKSKNIGINILQKKQKKLSLHFSKKNSQWDNIPFYNSNKKIPLIIDALVNLDCSLIKKFDVGDHYIFICKINYLKINDSKKPMIYFKNKYL